MWTNGSPFCYEGDCCPGDRKATPAEVTAWELSRLPSPLDQIAQIERDTLMNRATRELMLGIAEKEGAALGLNPEQLYVANVAYRSVKDVDNKIAALRGKL